LKLKLAGVIATALLWAGVSWGQAPDGEKQPPKEPSDYDRIWKFAEWHKNEENPVVQNVLFSGRFQYEYGNVDADQGSHHEWNIRRLRLGAKSKLFREYTLHVEADFNPQETDPFYVRLTDAYLQWSKSGSLKLTFGKHGVPFTMDGATSSKELLTIDRSNLANNMWFPQEYMPGVSAAGKLSNWVYHLGVYSAGEANRELGEFNGGVFTLTSIGYDFADELGTEAAELTANYVYQNPDRANTFTRQLQHMVSVHFDLEDGAWGLRTDLSSGQGYLGQSDLWGVMIMPFVNATDKLQFVGRHTYLKSENPNGIRLATYENRVVAGRGDRYNEGYIGANYYFYGHKLKLQSGLQFADMKDRATGSGTYSGVSFTSGLRVSW